MRKRAFICGLVNFPRGGASSNYVQYLAAALQETGYEVIVVTNINPEYRKLADYRGFVLEKILIPSNELFKKIFYKYTIGGRFVKKLSKYQLTENDRVILYTHHSLLAKKVVDYARKCGAKAGICLVECFAADDFANGKFDRQYIEEQKIYRIAQEACDFIFPISTIIQSRFPESQKKTFCLPILADTKEYPYLKMQTDQVKRFIYPANGRMKDGLQDMLEAIGEILAATQESIEFHFCGVSEESVEKGLQEGQFRTENKKRIFVHKWMKYDELIKLYQTMDFLLLAREDRQMTRANFPSKVPELLTFGVIPIASNVGDYTHFYLQNQENCIMMDGCSKAVIVDAIQQALQMDWNTVKKMSQNARRLAEIKFDYSVWSADIGKFLDSI